MSSTIAFAALADSGISALDPAAHLEHLGPIGRHRAYRAGEMTRAERFAWAARYPGEVPTVNGEVEWIGLRLADLD